MISPKEAIWIGFGDDIGKHEAQVGAMSAEIDSSIRVIFNDPNFNRLSLPVVVEIRYGDLVVYDVIIKYREAGWSVHRIEKFLYLSIES